MSCEPIVERPRDVIRGDDFRCREATPSNPAAFDASQATLAAGRRNAELASVDVAFVRAFASLGVRDGAKIKW